MSLYTALQTFTITSDASAGTSHPFTAAQATRAQGGVGIGPTTLILYLSYDGNTAGVITGITDSDGNTWTKGDSQGNGAGVNLEGWYAFNVKGGSIPSGTITTSASVKLKGIGKEVDQVRPVSAWDRKTGRVDTPAVNSTTRTSAASNTEKRRGMIEVIYAGIGWNDTRTCTGGGSGFTGAAACFSTLSGGNSNLGVAMAQRSVEQNNVAGANTIGRFVMSASDTQPAAVICLSFYRDGIVTSTDEDGTIDNLEGTIAVATTNIVTTTVWGADAAYRSSTSAPNGGTGGSETDHAYAFWPDYSSYLLTGVTIGSTFDVNLINLGSSDDGTSWTAGAIYLYKNNELGSTLDSGDDSLAGSYSVIGVPTAVGLETYTFNTASYYNTSGVTAMGLSMEGDTQGFISNSVLLYGDYDTSNPSYLKLTLTYPSSIRLLASTGVGT